MGHIVQYTKTLYTSKKNSNFHFVTLHIIFLPSPLLSSIATLRDQWTRYEEFYEQLNHWIKDTENAMKADSDLRASLQQKLEQINRHKVCVCVCVPVWVCGSVGLWCV